MNFSGVGLPVWIKKKQQKKNLLGTQHSGLFLLTMTCPFVKDPIDEEAILLRRELCIHQERMLRPLLDVFVSWGQCIWTVLFFVPLHYLSAWNYLFLHRSSWTCTHIQADSFLCLVFLPTAVSFTVMGIHSILVKPLPAEPLENYVSNKADSDKESVFILSSLTVAFVFPTNRNCTYCNFQIRFSNLAALVILLRRYCLCSSFTGTVTGNTEGWN